MASPASSVSFIVETVLAIVLFTTMTGFYTYVCQRLTVEYNRYIYSGADYALGLNRRTWAGILLFGLSILEILHASFAIFVPALSFAGQMKIFGLAMFNLFAFVISIWLFGGYLVICQFKQTRSEAEQDLELSEIVVPIEEEPTEEEHQLDDSLDLD